MKLPKDWAIGQIEITLLDESCNEVVLRTEEDFHGLSVEVSIKCGAYLRPGELYNVAEIADTLLYWHESLIEKPAASDEPATGFTPTADKEPSV
jgi:hypothetical protein